MQPDGTFKHTEPLTRVSESGRTMTRGTINLFGRSPTPGGRPATGGTVSEMYVRTSAAIGNIPVVLPKTPGGRTIHSPAVRLCLSVSVSLCLSLSLSLCLCMFSVAECA